jgi:hypothetical protein
MTVRRAAAHFGVSDEYLRRRITAAGLTKRIGSFVPNPWQPADLQHRASQLYATGLTVQQVGAALGVSATTISNALHATKTPVRIPDRRAKYPASRRVLAMGLVSAAHRRVRVTIPIRRGRIGLLDISGARR